MSQPDHEGLVERVREWFDKEIHAGLNEVKAGLAKTVDFAETLGGNVSEAAQVIEEVAGMVDPEAQPEVAALVARAQALAEKAAADLHHFLGS